MANRTAMDKWRLTMEASMGTVQTLTAQIEGYIAKELDTEADVTFDFLRYAVEDAQTAYLAKPIKP